MSVFEISGDVGGYRPLGLILLHAKLCCEKERAAHADRALHPDAPVHQLHELFGDSKAEPGTSVFARRRAVGLGEALEDGVQFFGGDSDARVRDCEPQIAGAVIIGVRLNPHFEMTLLRELDRVAEQINDDLAKPVRVADQIDGHAGIETLAQRQALGRGPALDDFHRAVNNLAQIHIGRFEFDMARIRPSPDPECRSPG